MTLPKLEEIYHIKKRSRETNEMGKGGVGGGGWGQGACAEFSYYVLKNPAFSRGAANTKNLLIFYEILQEMKCGYLDKINLPRLIMLRYRIDLLQTTDYSYLL